jgi:hypothetical protein
MPHRTAEPEEGEVVLTDSQKTRIMWRDDHPVVQQLIEERNRRRDRDQWMADLRRCGWQVVLSAGTVVGLGVGLKTLGIIDVLRQLLAP